MKKYRKIHKFDNGVKVYDDHLLDLQRERYKKNNVHEAEEEDVFINVINGLDNKCTYVNIGAAIGYYCILAKKLNQDCEIFAFEPMKIHRKYFKENMKLNNISSSSINIYKQGIFTKKDLIKFKVQHYGSMITPEYEKKSFFIKIKEILNNTRIPTITIDDIYEKADIKIINFLQMDIQGLEFDVLKQSENNLKNKKIERLLIGTHSKKIHDDCINLFKVNDYKIFVDNFDTKLQPDGIIYAESDSITSAR